MTAVDTLRARKGALVLALVTAALVGFLLLRKCAGPDAIAVLSQKSGSVDRDFGATQGAWKPAAVRAEFVVNDGVRTGKTSNAKLTLSDSSELALEASTIIRFLDRPSPAHQRFDLETGSAVLEAGSSEITLDTDVGTAVIAPGSRLTLKKSDQGMRYEVSVGTARFESAGSPAIDVTAGEGILVGIGTAKLERYDVKADTVPTAPSAAPRAPENPKDAGGPPPAEPTGVVTTHVAGLGATVRAPGESKFAKLPEGDGSIAAGSTLRLTSGTAAAVERGGQKATLRGAGEFIVAEAGKPFIITETGGVSLSGAETEVEVAVPGGTIVAKLGARGEVGVHKDATHVSVTSGEVELRTQDSKEVLAAGEEGTIGPKGSTDVVGRGPGYVDFVVGAGESFAVHDPHPPTAVGFGTQGVCPEGAVVELTDHSGARSRGTGTVSVLVPPGVHKYAVKCIKGGALTADVVANGTVAVISDAGTARIPRTAASTAVDTDGRNYTVLYQNILPKISVRWPNPPAASSYTLTVVSPSGKTETHTSGTAAYSFASGALREGVHQLSFDAGGTHSKQTHVDIKFDNAAPTATLTSPANGGFAPGSSVTVAGLALEGWKISVGGKNLPLDDQLRFSGDAVVPSGQRALAVEFVHPSRGVHYYLRRASGH